MLPLLVAVAFSRSVSRTSQLPILLEKEAESISLPPPPKSQEEERARKLDELIQKIAPAFEFIKHSESQHRMRKRIRRQVVGAMKEMGLDDALVDNINLMVQAQRKLANAKRILERIRTVRI